MTPSHSRDSARPVRDVRDDERDGVDGGIHMKVEAWEADMFEQCVHMCTASLSAGS